MSSNRTSRKDNRMLLFVPMGPTSETSIRIVASTVRLYRRHDYLNSGEGFNWQLDSLPYIVP